MKIKGKEYFSVSQLELWSCCRRAWYLIKRCGYSEDQTENQYLIRGKLVHEILETQDDKYEERAVNHKDFKRMNTQFQEETLNLFKLISHENKLPSKPLHRELEIINHELEMVAYLDVVGKGYIVDYKTSGFYGKVPYNYIWQLRIYATLYYLKTGILIQNLGVYYVKYGRIEWFKFSESDIIKVKKIIKETIKAINKSIKINDFDNCTNTGKYKNNCLCKKIHKV